MARYDLRNGCSGKEEEKARTLKISGSGGRRIAVGGGIGTVVLVAVYLLLGGDPMALLDSQQGVQLSQPRENDNRAPRDNASKFVAVVLADTEDAWHELFRQMGRQYQGAEARALHGRTRPGAGSPVARAVRSIARKIAAFTSISVFTVYSRRPGCRRRFRTGLRYRPRSWTPRHNLLGITDRVQAVRGRVNQSEYNQLSVRLELQADFLAGVWAHSRKGVREGGGGGDIEEAMERGERGWRR